MLNLKPVLQIQGDKLDAFSKARGKKKAKSIMLQAMKSDLEGRFQEYAKQGHMALQAAYAGNEEEAMEWKKELQEQFPGYEIYMAPLSFECFLSYWTRSFSCGSDKNADTE